MRAGEMQKQTQECHNHAVSQMPAPSRWAQLRRPDLRSGAVVPAASRALGQQPLDERIRRHLLGYNTLGCFGVFQKDVMQSTGELNTSLYTNNSHS